MELTYFWAKTTEDKQPGISVYQHMLNVGCVAQCLADMNPGLLKLFKLRSSEVGALAALHDIGKISPGFQRKCRDWLAENDLATIEKNGLWVTEMEGDHGKISHAVIQRFLKNKGVSCGTSSYLACVLGAHHGRLNTPNERGYQPHGAIRESRSGIDWDEEQITAASAIWDVFKADKEYLNFNEESPAYWWLAGLTSIADWIGSDEHYFPADHQKGECIDARAVACESLASIGLQQPVVKAGLSFFDLFEFQPNDMQRKAMSVITAPGVYVIEAPMGMGKTEAALGVAYHLLETGKAKGIYFALPTQATSNRIHLRMENFVKRFSPDSIRTKLIHCNSWLMTDELTPKIEEKSGRDWFASAKRALIAPFGVGTIDQALLGVVAAKHFFVRRFALAGKVVILDEVHSYDLYTGTLIDTLITTLESLGCTVIVLSATLTNQRRDQLLSSSGSSEENSSDMPYPLISGRKNGFSTEQVAATPLESREVHVEFINTEAASSKAISLAQKGGAVLWICDTVDSAQTMYEHLKAKKKSDFELGLLHSRFPFWRREDLETEWMQRLGKDGRNRCGCILVSTQIVEQSVDLDADMIITELAPTDMLLQRMGRLWRHERAWRPNLQPEFFIIEEEKTLSELKTMTASAIKSALGGKAYVYAPYILLRTLDLWSDISEITIPRDVRAFIESTYAGMDDEPPTWTELSNELYGIISAQQMMAILNSNVWQIALQDEEGVQTRINEIPTVMVVLCAENKGNRFVFIDETERVVEKSIYTLSVARAINKNLVKIPKYCFCDNYPLNTAFADYLYGDQAIGIVSIDGKVTMEGVKEMYSFVYTRELGLQIRKVPT